MGKEWASKQASKKRKKNKNKTEQDKINRKKAKEKVQKNPHRPRDTYIHTHRNPIKHKGRNHNMSAKDLQA